MDQNINGRTEHHQQKLINSNMIETDSPHVKCSKLPEHWRIRKNLGFKFRVEFDEYVDVKDNLCCIIQASNSKNNTPAQLKNHETQIKNGIAEFSDLRFLSTSGRDTRFHVHIMLCSNPVQVFTYSNAIKITVDGPRPKRLNNNNKLKKNDPLKSFKKYTNFSIDKIALDEITTNAKEPNEKHGNLSILAETAINSCIDYNSLSPTSSHVSQLSEQSNDILYQEPSSNIWRLPNTSMSYESYKNFYYNDILVGNIPNSSSLLANRSIAETLSSSMSHHHIPSSFAAYNPYQGLNRNFNNSMNVSQYTPQIAFIPFSNNQRTFNVPFCLVPLLNGFMS